MIVAALLLGLMASAGWLVGVDTPAMRAMTLHQTLAPGSLIDVAQLLSMLGDVPTRSVSIAIVATVLWLRHSHRLALVFLGTTFVSISGYTLAKIAYARARPTLAPWLDHPHGLSFPSGHAAGSAVVFLLAAHLLGGGRTAMMVAIVVSIAIGLTRPMLGVHWPSDVVGGWLWGGGSALVGIALAGRKPTAIAARRS